MATAPEAVPPTLNEIVGPVLEVPDTIDTVGLKPLRETLILPFVSLTAETYYPVAAVSVTFKLFIAFVTVNTVAPGLELAL